MHHEMKSHHRYFHMNLLNFHHAVSLRWLKIKKNVWFVRISAIWSTISKVNSTFLRRRGLPSVYESSNSFKASWELLGPQFGWLKNFFVGLSCIFWTTATVESDFSLINYHNDDNSQNISLLSLAGTLHGKQLESMRRLGSHWSGHIYCQ